MGMVKLRIDWDIIRAGMLALSSVYINSVQVCEKMFSTDEFIVM